MKIHEYQAKEIFSKYGIPVERHTLCRTAAGAVAAYKRMGSDRVVIKAQVLTGGRGKAGGVKLVDNTEDTYQEAKNILGMSIKGLPVNQILVSEAVDIAAEYYVSFTIDRNTRSVILMMSASGGMDIEEVARQSPEKIIRYAIDPFIGLPDYLARRFAFSLFPHIEQAGRMAAILQALYKIFMENDASLVEVNPLALTAKGILMAIDAKIVFDDNALYRHPDVLSLFDPTEEEKVEADAKNKGFSYVHMDGNIGCMVNGAGLAMATMDMIKLHGGNPANFLDIGGSSNPVKVVEAMKLLLQDEKVKVVLINIFGGITRCDDVAIGLIQAFDQIKSDIPVIVRLTGTNEHLGRDLLRNHSRFQIADGVGIINSLPTDRPAAKFLVVDDPFQPDAVHVGQVDDFLVVHFKICPSGFIRLSAIVPCIGFFNRQEHMAIRLCLVAFYDHRTLEVLGVFIKTPCF